MVRLVNIKQEGDTISCNFCPESSDVEDAGFIRIGRDGKIIEGTRSTSRYGDIDAYHIMATKGLGDLFDTDLSKWEEKEFIVMWY